MFLARLVLTSQHEFYGTSAVTRRSLSGWVTVWNQVMDIQNTWKMGLSKNGGRSGCPNRPLNSRENQVLFSTIFFSFFAGFIMIFRPIPHKINMFLERRGFFSFFLLWNAELLGFGHRASKKHLDISGHAVAQQWCFKLDSSDSSLFSSQP